MSLELSAGEARGLVLHSQGLGGERRGGGEADLLGLAQRLNAFQIDSVNVLVRAHYMPAFSRLGPYPTKALDALAYERRSLFEYWGHAACYLPIDLYPLFRWRMDAVTPEAHWREVWRLEPEFVEAVYQEVAERGPIGAGAVALGSKGRGGWWGWSEAKRAVELLFRAGRLAVAGRRNFERLYDLTERVLPPQALNSPAPGLDEARKQLLLRAAGSLGLGTADDLAGYFYIGGWWDRRTVDGKGSRAAVPRLVRELVEEGRLEPVSVEGWDRPAYVLPGTATPPEVHARALLSPFDPLIWERKPVQRIFGFDYKIEIYVPAPQRVYGYYCLPFLLGDRLVGRVDLKADRKSSTLLVPGAFSEPGSDAKLVAAALANELRLMASWLKLERISIGERGDLARPLARALGRRRNAGAIEAQALG